jgi:preprotein translocase subunit SecY
MAQQDLSESPVKELVRRFFVTFLLGVIVYRLGVFIPIPGVNSDALQKIIHPEGGEAGPLSEMLRYADMFNGGAIANASVFGLGITPYISASIILQLMTFSIPALKAMQKEGETGRRRINQYTRYATLVIALVQSLIAAIALTRFNSGGVVLLTEQAASNQTIFVIQSVLTITTGSMLMLWISEQITRFGIGNGVSMIIMFGIIAYLPSAFTQGTNDLPSLLLLVVISLLIIAAIIVVVQAVRRIGLEQQRRVQGNRVYGGAQTTLPLKLNQANVIPVIFASPVIVLVSMFAAKLAGFSFAADWLGWLPQLVAYGSPGHRYLFAALIIAFTYFYISITFDLLDLTNHFKQAGFFVRGVKPGKNTVDYIGAILKRVTFVGAIFLAVISILPESLSGVFHLQGQGAVLLGGTGLIIVVGVLLDVMQKVSAFLLAHQYGGLAGKGQLGAKSDKGKRF